MTLHVAKPNAELTEKEVTAIVVGSRSRPGIARLMGWRCYHTLRSKGSEPGYPDWTLVRERIVFLELKTEAGKVSPAQADWIVALEAAGGEIYVVRPRHIDSIAWVLRGQFRPRVGEHPAMDELEIELAHATERAA